MNTAKPIIHSHNLELGAMIAQTTRDTTYCRGIWRDERLPACTSQQVCRCYSDTSTGNGHCRMSHHSWVRCVLVGTDVAAAVLRSWVAVDVYAERRGRVGLID